MTDTFRWPDPIQVDPETVVTRQVGIPPEQLVAPDPVRLPDPIQGGEEKVTRQTGNGHSFYDATGVLRVDHPAGEDLLFSDGPGRHTAGQPAAPPVEIVVPSNPEGAPGGKLVAWAKPDQPPAQAIGVPPRATSFEGDPKTDQPSDVVASDKPLPGQPVEGAPQVFSAADLAAAKAAKAKKG